MATLLISEFTNAMIGVPGPIAQAPPSVQQLLTYTTSAASDAFAASTAFVRVEALGGEAYLEFGTAPTADNATSTLHLADGGFEYYAVIAGHKVAAYDGAS